MEFDYRLPTRTHIILGVIIILIMLPILFLPLGVDQVFFLQGGEVIARGGKIYVDYVDTKSPMIYYLFAGVSTIFGSSHMGVRGFELLWQLFSITVLIACIRYHFRHDILAYSSAIIYALLYMVPGMYLTLEGESLVAPLMVLLLHLQLRSSDRPLHLLLRGVVLALIMGCKYTLGIVIPAVLVYDFCMLEYSWRERGRRTLLSLLGLVIGLGVLFSPLVDPAIFQGFNEVTAFTKGYANIPPLGPELLQEIIKSTAAYFADKISLTVMVLIFIGAMLMHRRDYYSTVTTRIVQHAQLFLTLLITLLLLSVAIERKCIYYHYSRMAVPVSILAGMGFVIIYQWLGSYYRRPVSKLSRLLVLSVIGTALLFSPLMRWLKVAQLPVHYLRSREAYEAALVAISDPEFSPRTPSAIREYIHVQERDIPASASRVFVMGLNANVVSYEFHQTPICKVNSAACYYGIGSLPAWKEEMWKEARQAGWLVIENNDLGYIITGHLLTTWESVEQDKPFYSYLRANFDSTASIGGYYIFRRRHLSDH